MSMINTDTLTDCPACGSSLTQDPIMGDYRVFHCPTHRTFSVSGSAIKMAHNLPAYMEILGRRIQEARDNESNAMITADDLMESQSQN